MKALLISVCCALVTTRVTAAEVFVKQITIAVPFTGNVRFRECRYFVDESLAAKLPRFDPEVADSYLPPAKALSIAFERHFASHGLSKESYYREVQVSLEKTDDYTQSAVAQAARGTICQNLWFYIVSCGRPKFGETKLGPVPILVLMDGNIIVPKEELRGLPK